MNKQLMGAIMIGAGVTAVAGIMSAKKMKNKKAYNHMLSMKDEFGHEASYMAKKAGNGLMKAGKQLNRFVK